MIQGESVLTFVDFSKAFGHSLLSDDTQGISEVIFKKNVDVCEWNDGLNLSHRTLPNTQTTTMQPLERAKVGCCHDDCC